MLCARLSGRKSFAQLTPSPTRFTPQSISPWPRRKTHRSTSGALPRSSSTSPAIAIIEMRKGLLKKPVSPSIDWIGQSSITTAHLQLLPRESPRASIRYGSSVFRFYDYVRNLVDRLMRKMDGFDRSWRYDRIKEPPEFHCGWRRRMGMAPFVSRRRA
jgi:hypothetical protein